MVLVAGFSILIKVHKDSKKQMIGLLLFLQHLMLTLHNCLECISHSYISSENDLVREICRAFILT